VEDFEDSESTSPVRMRELGVKIVKIGKARNDK
jgi:hypothetical protein